VRVSLPHSLHENIFFPNTPVSRVEVDVNNRIDLTMSIHLGSKPYAWSIALIASYSTLSKAFSKSIC
jgi:hypothetical protein